MQLSSHPTYNASDVQKKRLFGCVYSQVNNSRKRKKSCGRYSDRPPKSQKRPCQRSCTRLHATAKTLQRHFLHQLFGCLHGSIFLKFRVQTDIMQTNEYSFGACRNSFWFGTYKFSKFAVFARRISLLSCFLLLSSTMIGDHDCYMI